MTEQTACEARDPYPASSPDLWFVDAVSYTIEMLRHFQGRAESPQVRAVLGRLMADLEMGEWSALDLVRELCRKTDSRRSLN